MLVDRQVASLYAQVGSADPRGLPAIELVVLTMKTRHIRLGVLVFVLACVLAAPAYIYVQSSCQELLNPQGDLVLVTDAATGKPITNARIDVSPPGFPPFPPKEEVGRLRVNEGASM